MSARLTQIATVATTSQNPISAGSIGTRGRGTSGDQPQRPLDEQDRTDDLNQREHAEIDDQGARRQEVRHTGRGV
jgi:hypothetical protein